MASVNMEDKQEEVQKILRSLYGFGITHGYEEYTRLSRKINLGLIVNPIAGMGGRVGLKGTSPEILEEAKRLGAIPVAPKRAIETLKALSELKNAFHLITYPEDMGENEAREAGFEPLVIGSDTRRSNTHQTTADDTREAASLLSQKASLLLFVGGDGTARDVHDGLKCNLPVIGVPSGVKMYSGVFAVNPQAAAQIIMKFIRTGLPLVTTEVMDIDEDEFRKGRLSADLVGYLSTPYEPGLVQSRKRATMENELESQLEIARYLYQDINNDNDHLYILGPGSTVFALSRILGIEKSLLGVDIVHEGKIIAKDANEEKILSTIDNWAAKIVVTPIGGQGFLFGRGNQQISPAVIKKVGKENILVIATRNKLQQMGKLRVDTGDSRLDQELKGNIRIITGYEQEDTIEIL
ncbi:MAG: ATP-NAD kinase family protein [Archaeoglobaceae archaeon]